MHFKEISPEVKMCTTTVIAITLNCAIIHTLECPLERMVISGQNLLKKELPSDTERVQSAPIYWRYISKRRKFDKKHLAIKSTRKSTHQRPHKS